MKKISLLFVLISFVLLSCVQEAKIPISLPKSQGLSPTSIASLATTVELELTPSELTFGGRSSLTAIVSENAGAVRDGTIVTFTLDNVALGTISPPFATTSNGIARALFTAGKTAPGQTNITAQSGTVVSAPQPMVINAPINGSIEFVSANPQVIGVKGSGQNVSSTVTFIVKDVQGDPVLEGTSVGFTLSGPRGGEYIGTSSGLLSAKSSTNSRGEASVILNSGSSAGPVTILASVDVAGTTTKLSSSSPTISIGGGVVSAPHFSLAATRLNLPGLVYSNRQSTISAYVADRFGNFNVLKGTSVSFYTEAGAIDASGITNEDGETSVKLRTQLPGPAKVSSGTAPANGHVAILATVMGEEGFDDENGNGQYDLGEFWTDLPEPFLDVNGNGLHNDGKTSPGPGFLAVFEKFLDVFLQDGKHTTGNGVWDGPGCKQLPSCQESIMLSARHTLAFTGTIGCSISPKSFSANGGTETFVFLLGDINNNAPVPGTTIKAETTEGELAGETSVMFLDGVGSFPGITFDLSEESATSTKATVTVTVKGADGINDCVGTASGDI